MVRQLPQEGSHAIVDFARLDVVVIGARVHGVIAPSVLDEAKLSRRLSHPLLGDRVAIFTSLADLHLDLIEERVPVGVGRQTATLGEGLQGNLQRPHQMHDTGGVAAHRQAARRLADIDFARRK